MNPKPESPNKPDARRFNRGALLVVVGASIIGWGCEVPYTVGTRSDPTFHRKYLPAAQKNDAIAQLQVALAYRFGSAGAPQDSRLAWTWLNRAAGNNLLEARYMLGDAHISGSWGNKPDIDAGLKILRAIAQTGARDAQDHLGTTLLDLFVKETKAASVNNTSTTNAKDSTRKASKPGAKDPAQQAADHIAEAAPWFEKAARAGNKHAALQLARLYERGQGVEQDRALAYAWFEICGDEIDTQRLDSILSDAERAGARQHVSRLKQELPK